MQELVVLVDNAGKPIGTAPKSAVHTADTPLHLAFSCYLFDKNGRFLLTQRAKSKKVWPGVWTNSFCGHLMPGETAKQAIVRRAQFELGLDEISPPKIVLPDYRYKTPPFNGIIENEICPVFVSLAESALRPNPDEVEDFKWQDWDRAVADIESRPDIYSWWLKDQLKLLKKSKNFKTFLATF